jgi:hypothetical protein
MGVSSFAREETHGFHQSFGAQVFAEEICADLQVPKAS